MSNSREWQALVYDLTRFRPEVGFGMATIAPEVGVKIGFTDHTDSVGEGHLIILKGLATFSFFLWGGGGGG